MTLASECIGRARQQGNNMKLLHLSCLSDGTESELVTWERRDIELDGSSIFVVVLHCTEKTTLG